MYYTISSNTFTSIVCPTGLEPVWSGFQSDALTISARDTYCAICYAITPQDESIHGYADRPAGFEPDPAHVLYLGFEPRLDGI